MSKATFLGKAIKFSFHATRRRKQRGITEEQVIDVIIRPEYVKKMPDGSKVAVKKLQKRTITVVYVEEDFIRVITVF